jgi:hypothetical protein
MKRSLHQLVARIGVACGMLFAAATVSGQFSPASSRPVTDAEVRSAIEAIVSELYDRYEEDSHWEGVYSAFSQGKSPQGGHTALVALALLYAGESPQQPKLREAITYLAELEMAGVYAVGIRASVWGELPPVFIDFLQQDADWLMGAFSQHSNGWTYGYEPDSHRIDNSCTQYGALGLWSAARRDCEVPPDYWRRLEERFVAMQADNGGWAYDLQRSITGSMTAAGLTVLFVTRDMQHTDLYRRVGQTGPTDDSIARGLAWFDANYSPTSNPGQNLHYSYYMYGVERVGLASGVKYFGGRDWYHSGAEALMEFLGTRTERRGYIASGNATTKDLAFGLLFLCRGRRPVAINKLQDDEWTWNNRPGDAAALAAFLSDEMEQTIGWQCVPADVSVEGWLDAPVLYIASHEDIGYAEHLTEADDLDRPRSTAGRIRQYVRRGGMVVAAADGSSRTFARSIEQLGRAMFPDAAWRRLPDDHAIFSVVYDLTDRPPEVWGLTNGVRELVILVPRLDPGLHLHMGRGLPHNTDASRKTYQLMSNVVYYASGMQPLPPRLAAYAPDEPSRRATWQRRLARASYGGPWDPEPEALPTFARWMRQRAAAEIVLTKTNLAALDDEADLTIVSGVDAYTLDDDELASIDAYLAQGGTILIETTGGRGTFSRSMEQQLAKHLGSSARSLARTPIVTGDGIRGAVDCRIVRYTAATWPVLGTLEQRPRLRGIELDGRVAVLFSHEDLVHALLGRPVWDVVGYEAEAARRLLRNILAAAR